MKNQKIVIGGVVIAIVLSLVAVFKHGTPGTPGQNGQNGQALAAATAGPDSFSPYNTYNGNNKSWIPRTKFNESTSTLNSYQLPIGTSTLRYLGCSIFPDTTGAALGGGKPYYIIVATSTKPSLSYPVASTSIIALGSFGGADGTLANSGGTLTVFPQATSTSFNNINSNSTFTSNPLVFNAATATPQYLIVSLGYASTSHNVNGVCGGEVNIF